MSLGICGKRVVYEEIFGSSSSPPLCASAKKPRSSTYGSPNRSEPNGHVSALLQMFPSLDPEVVERVYRNNNCDVEGAIECLGALTSAHIHGRHRPQGIDSAVAENCNTNVDQNQATSCSRMWEETIEEEKHVGSTSGFGHSFDEMKWVDLFVHEMMSSTDFGDARGRAARILEAFEHCISAQTTVSQEMELATLKGHVQRLLNDNQILKRAVAIQHERNLEQEEKTKGVQEMKDVINQYQEKLHSLQMNNDALKVHLQRARENSSITVQFLPDIF